MPADPRRPVTGLRSPGGTGGGQDAPQSPRRRFALLSLGALGIVFGDIGTSPLYAFREAFHATRGLPVDRASVLGILSLLFWSLLLIVTVKYLALVLRADNHGEGGIMAMAALLLPTGDRQPLRRAIGGLVGLGLFGTALLYGDGIITPAISVLAAVEGLEIAAPALGPYLVPIAVAILIGLFSVQRFGTGAVGSVFGPVTLMWFATLATLGIRWILIEPGVLAAMNPLAGLEFVLAQPRFAFLALGGVFLVVTGAEALYADMGHFGRRPIALGWFAVVLPALTLNYFGQGALLLTDPAAIANPFYSLAPPWALLPLIGLSTLATVIASQALISGAFSLTMQAVQLGYLPRVEIDHTSSREFGQVYIPVVNAALMVACITLVVTFRTSSSLAAAYGIAVTTTMVITTILLAAVMRQRWGWSGPLVIAVIVPMLAVDLTFFAANILKLPDGGWIPLVIGALVFGLMRVWSWGRTRLALMRQRKALTLDDFAAEIDATQLTRVPGTAIYLGHVAGATPRALITNVQHYGALREHVYIVTAETLEVPRVHPSYRTTIRQLPADITEIALRFGFSEDPDVPTALAGALGAAHTPALKTATYFIGRETVIARGPLIRTWRAHLYALLYRNASSPVAFFSLPTDRIVQVGTVTRL